MALSLDEILKQKAQELVQPEIEESLAPIRAKITELEEVKNKLNDLLTVEWKKWTGHSVDTEQVIDAKSRHLGTFLDTHKAVLDKMGITTAGQLAEDPTFAEAPEIAEYKGAKEQSETLNELNETLRADLATEGVVIPEPFSYDALEVAIKNRLTTLEQEIAQEKLKTPEGKEARQIELYEKYVDQGTYKDRVTKAKSDAPDGKWDSNIVRAYQIARLSPEEKEEALLAIQAQVSKGTNGSMKDFLESSIAMDIIHQEIHNQPDAVYGRGMINGGVSALERDVQGIEKKREQAKKGLEYVKLAEMQLNAKLDKDVSYNRGSIEFSEARKNLTTINDELEAFEKETTRLATKKQQIVDAGYAQNMLQRVNKISKDDYDRKIGAVDLEISTNKTNHELKKTEYQNIRNTELNFSKQDFNNTLGDDGSTLRGYESYITENPKNLREYFSKMGKIFSEEANKTVPQEKVDLLAKGKVVEEKCQRSQENCILDFGGDPRDLLQTYYQYRSEKNSRIIPAKTLEALEDRKKKIESFKSEVKNKMRYDNELKHGRNHSITEPLGKQMGIPDRLVDKLVLEVYYEVNK